jgi:hypothetical protein
VGQARAPKVVMDSSQGEDTGMEDDNPRVRRPPKAAAAAATSTRRQDPDVPHGSAIAGTSNAHCDSAYSAILNDRNGRFTIKHLHGDGEADCKPQIGSFFEPTDKRSTLAFNKSYFANKQNVSFSFNPSTLTCSNCKDNPGHTIIGNEGASIFVLSDQCFPAALPAAGAGGCIPILRLENGTVNELAKLMLDVFAGTQIRVGSLILISSVSHLAAVGTAAYAEALVRASKFLLSGFSDKVTVRLGIPVLLGGAGDSTLVRSLLELEAWADSLPSKDQCLTETRAVLKLSLTNGGVGKVVQAEKLIFQLPISLSTFEKKTFVSGPRLTVYNKINPFDTPTETLIIEALVSELNKKHGTDLATDIDFTRSHGTVTEDPDADPAVVIVGNSHANYLATAMAAAGYKSVVVEMRPWRPNAATVKETKLELEAKLASTSNVIAIVYWCLDHAAFYSITEDSILPAVRDTSGHYHIHGDLITAPSEMFTGSVKACTPLFSIHTAAKKILLSPLPRYWHSRCCDDSDHVSNLDEADFENSLFTGLDGLRRIIKDTLFLNSIRDVTIFNTSQLCVSLEGSRTTSTDVMMALAIMWGDDAVHPSRDCYTSLAENLHASLSQSTQPSAASSTASDRPLKRPRWLEADATTTVTPRDPSRGRGRGNFPRARGGRGMRRPRGFRRGY